MKRREQKFSMALLRYFVRSYVLVVGLFGGGPCGSEVAEGRRHLCHQP